MELPGGIKTELPVPVLIGAGTLGLYFLGGAVRKLAVPVGAGALVWWFWKGKTA